MATTDRDGQSPFHHAVQAFLVRGIVGIRLEAVDRFHSLWRHIQDLAAQRVPFWIPRECGGDIYADLTRLCVQLGGKTQSQTELNILSFNHLRWSDDFIQYQKGLILFPHSKDHHRHHQFLDGDAVSVGVGLNLEPGRASAYPVRGKMMLA
jgi:hypothetical protein